MTALLLFFNICVNQPSFFDCICRTYRTFTLKRDIEGPFSSAEVFLCRRETGEREKESARRSRGDCYFSIFFFMRYSAGAYAEEKVEGRLSRRLPTKEQLILPLVCNKVD